jgi:hypothetical protein
VVVPTTSYRAASRRPLAGRSMRSSRRRRCVR